MTRGTRVSPSAIFRRGVAESRDIISAMFIGTVMDIGAVAMFVVLLVTAYR